MTSADAIVDNLRTMGVCALFGVPGGGGNLDLIAAAGRNGMPFVLTATETAGAISALAQAELTGRPGACLTTLGPGAASVVNGVACAFLDRAPIFVFTDSQAGGGLAVYEHQRLDHAAMLAPITKYSATLDSPGFMQTLMTALHHATSGPPGPVHLDCPGGVLSAPPTAGDDWRVRSGVDAPLRSQDFSRVEVFLRASRKPLLLVGLGARRAPDAAAIRSLCSSRGIPALVTYKAKGVVADDDPWFAGLFTNAAIEQPILDESDLLIGVGLDPVELIPRPWQRCQPIVSIGPWRVADAHIPFAEQLVMPADGVRWIEHALQTTDWDPGRVREHAERQRGLSRIGAPRFSAQRVVELAAARLGQTARVTVDAGAHMFPATVLWPVGEPNGMLISNGLSTMGFALPAAVGAAMMERHRPHVALTGDGGLLMCAGELLTAVREGLRIMTIVFNDASLSLIEIKQQARGLPASGVALGAVDWALLARSVGMPSWTATDEATLDGAIAGAMAVRGPALIEARIDRSNYGATLRAVRG
jgi:acetolactate synthase-1/2/3 large subunit